MAAVCALDIGTTRIKALLLSEEARPGPVVSVPSVLASPGPGLVEVDAEALWRQALAALRAVASGGQGVEALAISNQRATVFLVDDAAHPCGPGLSWQDTRGARALAAWLDKVGRAHFVQTTGLVPSAIWSLAKVLWWQERTLPRGARIATVQDWLLRRLGAPEWVLDHANASLTGLLNVHSLAWDAGLLQAAGLLPGQLPSLVASGAYAGRLSAEVAQATGLPAGMPLIVGGGDQQCAALGAGALEPGTAAVSLGTAGVVSVPAGRAIVDPAQRLVGLAHVVPGRWVLEGLENTYGGAVSWARKLLGAGPVELAAEAPVGSEGLIFLPFLAGEGAPDYDSQARAVFVGLTLAHGRAAVARAILEGASVELARILSAARELAAVERVVASGGGAHFPLLLEMLAGLAGVPVALPPHPETSLVGAGLLAWVGLGRFPDAGSAARALAAPQEAAAPVPEAGAAYRALYDRYEATLAGLRRGGVLGEVHHG